MLRIKTLSLLLNLLAISGLLVSDLQSMEASSSNQNSRRFDLYGDGNLVEIKFPFDYYQAKQGDKLTLIHQGGYKVYNLKEHQNHVAVIGLLRPCIGIAVTDSINLITFHKHSCNSLQSIKIILEANLDLIDKTKLFARIYTTRDDVEWTAHRRASMHGGQTHQQEVKSIKDFLESIGIPRGQILANIWNVRNSSTGNLIYPDHYLGRYEFAELFVAVRLDELFQDNNNQKQIKFTSIDPITEDAFGYKGTMISLAELYGEKLDQAKLLQPDLDYSQKIVSYDNIPEMVFLQTGNTRGYGVQRVICERRLKADEDKLYLSHFKSKSQVVTDKNPYNSLEFYPIIETDN